MDPLFEVNIEIPEHRERTLVELFSHSIKLAIQEGRLTAGYKMPSTREFSYVKRVSRNTIISVYDDLCMAGYLETYKGKGTFVKSQKEYPKAIKSTQQQNRLTSYWKDNKNDNFLPEQPISHFDFKVGVPNIEYFPFHKWRQSINKAMRMQLHPNMTLPPKEGLISLRKSIVSHLSYSRAISSRHEHICITSGAQQAIDIICRILIESGKTTVAMESPGYPMARHLFKMHGANIIYIDVDEQGMCIDKIPNNVQLIYTTPSHQFPTGVAMSLERRQKLLQFANTHNISIIEDDYDGEFRLGSTPIDALKSLDSAQNIFYIGTFSKCMFPDIRLGYCVLPEWAVSAFSNAKFHMDWHNSSLLQEALSLFITEGHLRKHIRKMRKIYQDRYHAIYRQIKLHCSDYLTPANVLSGVHLSAKLTDEIDALSLVNDLQQQGISMRTIGHFEKGKKVINGLVFGYSNITVEQINRVFPSIAITMKHMIKSLDA